MTKKEYIIPQVEVVKIQNMNLLAGSVSGGGVAGDIGWGGDGSGVTPGAPELPGMPESPLDITPEKLLGFPF
jgi:hypothetical protein